MYELTDYTKIEYQNRLYNKLYSKWFILQEEKKIGKQCVVFITPLRYTQSERYRVEHMMEVIGLLDDWYSIAITMLELEVLYRYINCIDIVVFARIQWTKTIEDFRGFCFVRGIPVIYEVDDMVTDTSKTELIINSIGSKRKIIEDGVYLNDRIAVQCDALWTTNGFLARRLNRQYNKQVLITQNFMNKEQEIVAEEFLLQKMLGKVWKEPFAIGYFSGTNTHNLDFKECSSAIKYVMRMHEDVILKVVGYLELPEELREFYDDGRIKKIDIQKPCALEKEIAEVDINIIPLCINEFTNCKSEIKYFEAAMAGTPSLMSATYSYNNIVELGGPGIICKNKNDWKNGLEKLYNMKKQFDKKNAMMKSYHRFAWENYSYYNQCESLEKTLSSMLIIND